MGVHGCDLFPFNLLMDAFLSSDLGFRYELVVRYHSHRYRLVFSSLREANWDKKSQGGTAEWNMRVCVSKPGFCYVFCEWLPHWYGQCSLINSGYLREIRKFVELFCQVFLVGFDVWFWSTLLRNFWFGLIGLWQKSQENVLQQLRLLIL